MKKVGFVGLGTMGAHMARHILEAGYELYVFNRTAKRMKPLVEEGATPCASPAELGERCELAVVCVSDAPDVEAVVLGSSGIAQGMREPGIIVDCSTSSPALARRMAEDLKPRGLGILDAPVSGGPEGAKNATLSIMVGGDEAVMQRAMPVLQAMGKTITHIGPAGSGQMTKAINQILTAIHMEAAAEAIALAQKNGIDAEKVFQAVSSGAAQSWILKMRGPLMLREEFEPANFTLSLHAKDLRIAMDAMRGCGAKLDLAARVHDILQSLESQGYGNLDHSCTYLHVKKENAL